nr:GNAT family N-acetyltransferase [Natronocalculus amylovorans]
MFAEANSLIFTHFFSTPHYADIRPFTWNNFTLTTKFTYFVDLRPTKEELLMSFSKDARQNIRSTDEAAYEVYVGEEKDLMRTNEMITQRHEEHDATYNVSSSFLLDLYEALPDGMMNVYLCKVADQFAGGHITLETKDMSYGWQGWGDVDVDIPVNDLIEWTIMNNARDKGAEWYDFNGANVQRLSKYKAKFNPELRAYKRIEKGMPGMDFVSEVYKRIR